MMMTENMLRGSNKLYYVHDPMCSWCWAFRPVWQRLQGELAGSIDVVYVLGGLAADSDEPMSQALQQKIQQYWHTIEERVPKTRFNFDFWQKNIARRSTYPACRAVIAARYQSAEYEESMIDAIQNAYYLQAKNPSDDDVLLACANALDLNTEQFKQDMVSDTCQQQLQCDIEKAQRMGVQGFPSLVLQVDDEYHEITVDYENVDVISEQIKKIVQQAHRI